MPDSELCSAIKNRNTELAKDLLKKGAFPGVEELFAACVRKGLTEIVELLILSNDAKSSKYNKNAVKDYIHAYEYGMTPLIAACMNGCIYTAILLIEKGADVNYSTILGTPLSFAIEYEHFDIARLIIRKKLLQHPAQEKPDFIQENIELSKYWDNCRSVCETPICKTKKNSILEKVDLEKTQAEKTKPSSLFFSSFHSLPKKNEDSNISESATNIAPNSKSS